MMTIYIVGELILLTNSIFFSKYFSIIFNLFHYEKKYCCNKKNWNERELIPCFPCSDCMESSVLVPCKGTVKQKCSIDLFPSIMCALESLELNGRGHYRVLSLSPPTWFGVIPISVRASSRAAGWRNESPIA